jgi:hypothetical protein
VTQTPLAGRIYVPKTYAVSTDRNAVVQVLEEAVVASGARLIYSSFRSETVAPMYLGAEDHDGHRYGLLVYPFTTTRRETKNRPPGERRTQIRFGDPTRERDTDNPLARDTAGVDVTLALCVDPEERFILGLDPLIYQDLPMGISVYYNDRHVTQAAEHGWAVWERKKTGGTRRRSWEGLETLVGFRPSRLLDYARFEARASSLGLAPGLRQRLAEQYISAATEPHRLGDFFGVGADTILDIIDGNFRLGVAVRGGVAEHHLEQQLNNDPSAGHVAAIDEDGKPDFRVKTTDGRELLIECKTASGKPYANGDHKVEVQKTRDSGAGRKYTYDQFDILAACLFSATGLWEFRYRWAKHLQPWKDDPERIGAVQRIDKTWSKSLEDLLATR